MSCLYPRWPLSTPGGHSLPPVATDRTCAGPLASGPHGLRPRPGASGVPSAEIPAAARGAERGGGRSGAGRRGSGLRAPGAAARGRLVAVCGRYAASRRAEDVAEEFEVDETGGQGPGEDPANARPDYNVAPTKRAPVVLERRSRHEGETGEPDDPAAQAVDADGDPTVDAALEAAQAAATRTTRSARASGAGATAGAHGDAVRWLRLLTWGLVPSWAKDRSTGTRMINARAETLLDRPVYKRAALSRRCLVPADGWYEWQKSPTETVGKGKPRKQPFFIHPVADGQIALAGVYEMWRNPAVHPDDPGAWLATYAVITTTAERGLDVIHDRMPLVLPRDRWDDWLDPQLRDPDAVRALLQPPVPGRFLATPVTNRVNSVSNNGPQLIEPAPRDQLHGVVDPQTGELIGGGDGSLF
jgi:putative SOS response-associated peptidase YedK